MEEPQVILGADRGIVKFFGFTKKSRHPCHPAPIPQEIAVKGIVHIVHQERAT